MGNEYLPDYDGMVDEMWIDEQAREFEKAGVPDINTWIRVYGKVGRVCGLVGNLKDGVRVTAIMDTECNCPFWACGHKHREKNIRWPQDFQNGKCEVITA